MSDTKHFEKVRDVMVQEALQAHTQLWNEYAKLYRQFESQLEDVNLSLEQKRELTRSFDKIVWGR